MAGVISLYPTSQAIPNYSSVGGINEYKHKFTIYILSQNEYKD